MKNRNRPGKSRLLLLIIILPTAWWGTRAMVKPEPDEGTDAQPVSLEAASETLEPGSGVQEEGDWFGEPSPQLSASQSRSRYLEFLRSAREGRTTKRTFEEFSAEIASRSDAPIAPPDAPPNPYDQMRTIEPEELDRMGATYADSLDDPRDSGADPLMEQLSEDEDSPSDALLALGPPPETSPGASGREDLEDDPSSPDHLTAPIFEPFQTTSVDDDAAKDAQMPKQVYRDETEEPVANPFTKADSLALPTAELSPAELNPTDLNRETDDLLKTSESSIGPDESNQPGGLRTNPFMKEEVDFAPRQHQELTADQVSPLPEIADLQRPTIAMVPEDSRRPSLSDSEALPPPRNLGPPASSDAEEVLLQPQVPTAPIEEPTFLSNEVTESSVWNLTLAEAIEVGIENSPDIKAVRFDPEIRRTVAGGELGNFDPLGGVSVYGGQDDRLVRSLVDTFAAPVDFRDTDLFTPLNGLNNFYVRQKLRHGGSYEFGYGMDYRRFDPVGSDLIVPSGWESSINFQFSQPLLRGRGKAATLRSYYVALAKSEQAGFEAQARTRQFIRDIEVAYWQLATAYSRIRVAQQYVQLGEELAEQESRRRDAGDSGRSEQLQTRVLRADFDVALQAAIRDANIAEKRLRTAMGIASQMVEMCDCLEMPQALTELPIRPLIDASVQPIAMDLDSAVAHAMNRPVFGVIQSRIHAARHNLAAAKNSRLPQLDATALYRKTGLDQSLDDANRRLFNRRFDTWGVGITYEQSAYQRSARNSVRRFELTIAKEEMLAESLANQIAGDLARLKSDIEGSYETFQARRDQVNALRESVEAMDDQYRSGQAPLFQRLEMTRDLQVAELEAIRAWGAMQAATAQYRYTRGDEPTDYGMVQGL